MATSVNNVAQPPLVSPIVDSEGKLNRAWASWFRDLYRRVAYKGGNSIDDNADAIDGTIDTLEEVINQVLLNVIDINQNEQDIANNAQGISSNAQGIGQNADDISTHTGASAAHGSNGAIIGANDLATLLLAGLVKKMEQVADAVNATGSPVSVTSPDATAAPVAYDQVQVETIVVLANETKADVNTLVTNLNTVVTEVNAIVTQLNDLIAKSKTAGQMNV